VLKLDIPFLEFQEYLGLPKRGVAGDVKGSIDYMAFLLRFRPVNVMLHASHASGDLKAHESMEHLVEMLSKNRYELDSLFRHFDTNGDGVISTGEFREGIASLATLLKREFSLVEVEAYVDIAPSCLYGPPDARADHLVLSLCLVRVQCDSVDGLEQGQCHFL
jgi:hypothetical protein